MIDADGDPDELRPAATGDIPSAGFDANNSSLGTVRQYRAPRVAWYGPSTNSTMRASIIRLGALLLAGALLACATSGEMGMTGGGGSGFERVSPHERIGAGGAAAAPAVAGTSVTGIQAVVAGVAVTTTFLTGAREPNDVGKDGERRIGLTGPKERIPSLTGTAGYRVPDGLTQVTIEEVKNAVKLSTSDQLRDFLLYARATGRTFILWVRSNTKLVGELGKWEARGLIKVERIL